MQAPKSVRPFEGVKILDCTHVLAGPFATYQLAVLGADVIKVEDPNDPDQMRELGSDPALNQIRMGTGFLNQSSNKRSVALNLKSEGGRTALKRLVTRWADVFVENYRAGAFEALGIGYNQLSKLQPKLIYASLTTFGQDGPKASYTGYDPMIQASSGITASNGTDDAGPLRVNFPVMDYATGTMGAFALASALFQRERTGRGQYIDLAMQDVALMFQGYQVTDYLHSGYHPKRMVNNIPFAESLMHEAKDGPIQLGAGNRHEHKRFYEAIGEPDEAARSSWEERVARFTEKYATIATKMREKTAGEWEDYFQSRHIPAARVRELREALGDPQLSHRAVLHRHEVIPGVSKPVTVPLAAFKLDHGGPSIERPPPRVGQHTDEVLHTVGYTTAEIGQMRELGEAG
jgi:crotonobetainyl-CoA:carnitine CoA-transferase CaiB-like acyl-CoA transferase